MDMTQSGPCLIGRYIAVGPVTSVGSLRFFNVRFRQDEGFDLRLEPCGATELLPEAEDTSLRQRSENVP